MTSNIKSADIITNPCYSRMTLINWCHHKQIFIKELIVNKSDVQLKTCACLFHLPRYYKDILLSNFKTIFLSMDRRVTKSNTKATKIKTTTFIADINDICFCILRNTWKLFTNSLHQEAVTQRCSVILFNNTF